MLLLSLPALVNPEIQSTVSVSQIRASKPSSDPIQQSGQFCLDVNASSLSSSEPAIALLMPLYQDKESVLFAQGRIGHQHKIKSTELSLGVGQRQAIHDHWWLGYNFFYDAHWKHNHHSRWGLGLEARKNYLTLALNGYYPLSAWKGRDIDFYAYRPARGVDMIVNAYLPQHPQLGMMVKGEHYFDKQLTHAQKPYSPSSLSVALHYTPVPLLTAGYSYQIAKHGFDNQKRFHLSLNYQLSMTLKEQLDSTAVAHYRQLAGSRLEPVQRSYQMVLASRCKFPVLSRLKIDPKNLTLALESYGQSQELADLIEYFLNENTQADEALIQSLLNTVCEYNGPDRETVIPNVLRRTKEIQQMGSWDNPGGEAAPDLVVLGASWPDDSRLVIDTEHGPGPQTYGQGHNEIRIRHAGAHYQPIVNGAPVEAGGNGDCFYHSILHILGNNNASAVQNLRNEVARTYLENPTIRILGVEEKAWDYFKN